MDTILAVITYASFIIAGAVVVLNGIAPLTRTPKDDKFRDFLAFVHDKILVLVLPFVAAQVATKKETK